MTTQLLMTELVNLVQESKRKHNDLRQAADKSLEELKQLGNVSEQAAADQLSHKPSFVNPFIIACGTKNAKFTGIAIVCLQRLIVARALPRSKLNQVLEALMQASSAGLDVQLKILQALPSLLQNYAPDLKGDLLVTALNVCFILQSSKNAIVNNTAAATLQQLVVSVFDKVVAEDKNASDAPVAGEAPSAAGQVALCASALDAYRIFNDLCLITENQRPEFLRFSGLPQTFGLELIESVITNHATVFTTHPEQAQILRARVIPLVFGALKGKPPFATTLLDQDAALWKRALCMEMFRGIFAEHALVRRIYALYDAKYGQKDIMKTLVATFVRLSTEKPAVIGLGSQSTLPAADTAHAPGAPSDQAMLEASGMTGIIGGGPLGPESSNAGISVQWSSVRVPCIDQLDKTEPPPIPESYIYSLVLTCISSLSDGLAKFILPLTVPGEGRNRRKALAKHDNGHASPASTHSAAESPLPKGGVPLNPLELEDHPMHEDIKVCASIVDECWPAILATCSTFLYASLDQEYYHGLVRAFQRFAHVAGLLHLSTPRDAFLTTLGKSAVPPNVLTACHSSGLMKPSTPSPQPETPTSTLFSNARGLLGVDGLTPTSASSSAAAEKQRQASMDTSPAPSLNTRNLLCLRALLNLGIALGPTLGPAWGIILETLQQADFVLFTTGKATGRTPSLGRSLDQTGENDASSLMTNFSNEVRAVETAASRLIESSVDYPNASFVEVVEAVCGLLEQQTTNKSQADGKPRSSPVAATPEPRRPGSDKHRRMLSFSNQASGASTQEFLFALTKLGEIATINIDRLLTSDPDASGWHKLIKELINKLGSLSMAPPVRVKAAETLSRLMLEAASVAAGMPGDGEDTNGDSRGPTQLRVLGALRDALTPLLRHARGGSVADHATDIDVHRILLESLKSIIEGCGENLVCGWDTAFDIIGSVFETEQPVFKEKLKSATSAGILTTRSSKLVRSSFSSLQLICSDFLPSLPKSCFLTLVDTLYKFCSQDDDLNIALTTVTFFWVLSDFLSANEMSLDITEELIMKRGADESGLERLAADRGQKGSDAALWMLLLLRLTSVTTDERLEVRNSAIQTLLRIFDAYGDRLSAEAWSACVESVIFRLLSSLEAELKAAADEDDIAESERLEWHGTAVVVINGISGLLADYLDVLTTHQSFNRLWRELLEHLTGLLDFQVLDINTATFKALTHILSQFGDEKKATFNETSVESVWDLWSRGIPTSKRPADASAKAEDNQNCLIAYVAALCKVYMLLQGSMTVERVRRMLTLLRETVEEASMGTYVLDVEHATPLQTQVLAAMQMIRTDVDGVPSAIVNQVSEFVVLAYERGRTSGNAKRTFVAMSKAGMKMLHELISSHASVEDVYTSGALANALSALCMPIALKYRFPIVTKSSPPWRLATSSVLEVLGATLPQLAALDIPKETVQRIWAIVVAVADGILGADADSAPPGSNLADDEDFDIESFRKLRTLIIPSLGGDTIEDKTRRAYTESLFRTSIIHGVNAAERFLVDKQGDGDGAGPDAGAKLVSLYTLPPGRTTAVAPTGRMRVAYVSFDELFSLASAGHGNSTEAAAPKPASQSEFDSSQVLRLRIASTAAPLLILRCALTIRGYAADQPLRGKMPQPLSQRKELLWTLRKLVELESEGEAMPALGGARGEGRRHLLKLYPLIVKSLGVEGDREVQKLLRDALGVIGGEMGIV
ncbi:guanine nucleotide exchange factor [Hirsutella rhossiliensis]|uniref:Guanine nucleotide exchange factor n=1 Tax=Hirsutella rhossiliensis TaxID=111463 RepID=A0A9P8MQJ7_9HYPO|nr:guanine nucleotide exchange factor [Hirsutella rhossiliensis]KAH0958649.1 guanine nucleotide exchange factor [Hirsutella rhossiliensis]